MGPIDAIVLSNRMLCILVAACAGSAAQASFGAGLCTQDLGAGAGTPSICQRCLRYAACHSAVINTEQMRPLSSCRRHTALNHLSRWSGRGRRQQVVSLVLWLQLLRCQLHMASRSRIESRAMPGVLLRGPDILYKACAPVTSRTRLPQPRG